MATQPAFASTPNRGVATLNSGISTSTTAPTNTVTVFTAGSNGSKLETLRITQILTVSGAGTYSGIINIFLYNGSNYYLVDWYGYTPQTVSSTTTVPPVDLNTFPYSELKSGDTIVAVNTVASGTGSTGATHTIICGGGDL